MEVRITYGNKEYIGKVCGLKLKYPTVYINELGRTFQFSWSAIERAVNDGTALKGD